MDIDISIGQHCLQEIVSMTNQLYFVHALNRMSQRPFRHCAFTGINGRLKERFDNKLNGEYVKFSRMEWRSEDVQEMRQAPVRSEDEWKEFRDGKRKTQNAPTISVVDLSSTPLRNPFEGQEYVYLSADAEEELDTLKENETYIIGGIVDRNRYKVSPAFGK
jgi:tRNA (guanine9-N1)-methyltransferase